MKSNYLMKNNIFAKESWEKKAEKKVIIWNNSGNEIITYKINKEKKILNKKIIIKIIFLKKKKKKGKK